MDALSDCPCAGKNLDRFIQPAVLAVLAEGPLHGYRVLKSLSAMPMFAGRQPDATGIYRFLKAMEDRDLVESKWDLSGSGPAKRFFTLTPAGKKCVAGWVGTIEAYHAQVGQLLGYLKGQSKAPGRLCACRKAKRGAA